MHGKHSVLLSFAWILIGVCSQLTPPSMYLDNRTWDIPEDEVVGSRIAQVKTNNNDDSLMFSLEVIGFYNSKNESNNLPFTIHPYTGVVKLNESVKGRAGEQIKLYVIATNGFLPAKIEVFAKIGQTSQNNRHSFLPSLPLGFPRPNLSLANNPPPSIVNNGPANYFPGSNSTKPHFQQKTYPEVVPPRRTTAKVEKPILPKKTHLTRLEPVNKKQNKTDITTQPTSKAPEVPVKDEKSNEIVPYDQAVKSQPELTATIVPIVSVCGVFLVVGLLAIIFRKKICPAKPDDTKDDMRKESSGGIVLQENPSLAMQQWRGPRAFSNRYEPWDREINHSQVINQISSTVKNPDRWEFPRHRLKFFNILGEGAFGQVWKCEALDVEGNESGSAIVAVKTLKENANEKERSDLVSELQVMKMLEPHPNVVRLLGCCTEKEPIFLIMEYISKGKLQSYLRSSRAERHYNNMHGQSKSLTSRDLTSFAYQVAKGMEFLSTNGIIHRDLAARNILISEEHTCKVADFGFARDVIASHVYERKSEGRLPIRWMAPESLYDNIFSVKSDVWSFGVLIWEIVTLGSTPYPGLSAAEVMRKVREGYRLDKPEHCRRELYNIMYYCWDKDPKQRPSFSECIELLEKLLVSETDYIELERFPDHSYYNMMSFSGEKL
ncbi:unnamed protein product [Brassicogethes aeneus]|uniref:receptor protein-tyrosine kinase n=1 Tax=Brassicogethes aeneus TaxID=1431903 RepID=A0A9P0BAG3_BRAAE|nr:unnamed protein product [Brassicogethes aeneus]